jgi:energy-coupling factor transport system ATP-binding protein
MGKIAPAVEVSHLYYKYSTSDNWTLQDINLRVAKGDFFGIIGPSGGGKSTLLTLLRGFYQEIGGEIKGKIKVFGKDVSKVTIGKLGQKIGIVFQNPALQLHQLRVIDEVASAPMYQGIPYEECLKRASNLVDKFLGREFYDLSPNELSAGQQQKVALAASLSLNADILLLDEPFSFLDETADKEFISLLNKLHQEGKTIIIATHDIGQIADIATSLAVIDNGKIILKGKPNTVLYSEKLSKILPPPLFVQFAQKLKLKDRPLSWKDLLLKVNMTETKSNNLFLNTKIKLSLQNVSFSYPKTNKGVKNINFDIQTGKIMGIIGANGSGKTTLAKIILGLIKPDKGTLLLDKKDITKLPTEKRARYIGYATQDPLDMFFESNIWDEVAAGPRFLDLSNPETRAEKILKKLNLWQYKDKHPDSVSGGEKSKLGIADILVNNTNIILLDEPEFGLDLKSWEKVTDILKNLKDQGKTIIVITQDLEAAFFLCDEIAVLKNGRILKTCPSVNMFKDEVLLKEAGLPVLPFHSLLKNIPSDITLSKQDLLELARKK